MLNSKILHFWPIKIDIWKELILYTLLIYRYKLGYWVGADIISNILSIKIEWGWKTGAICGETCSPIGWHFSF